MLRVIPTTPKPSMQNPGGRINKRELLKQLLLSEAICLKEASVEFCNPNPTALGERSLTFLLQFHHHFLWILSSGS
jgi:hypothetical protein